MIIVEVKPESDTRMFCHFDLTEDEIRIVEQSGCNHLQ